MSVEAKVRANAKLSDIITSAGQPLPLPLAPSTSTSKTVSPHRFFLPKKKGSGRSLLKEDGEWGGDEVFVCVCVCVCVCTDVRSFPRVDEAI